MHRMEWMKSEDMQNGDIITIKGGQRFQVVR